MAVSSNGRQTRPKRAPRDPEEYRASLGEHLEELRQRLFRIAALLAVGAVAGWFLQPWVYTHLTALIRDMLPPDANYTEAFRSVTEAFFLKMKMAAIIGLILTFPWTLWQLWGFIAPGLKPSERRPVRLLVPISILLFAIGSYFGWTVMPSAFAWFLSFQGEFPDVAIIQEPGTLIFFILKMILAFGICFQLPTVVFGLAKVGILGADTLRQYWRHAVVVIFFLAAALTPSADPFSMLMLAVPLTLLFFASIVAVRVSSRAPRDPLLDQLD